MTPIRRRFPALRALAVAACIAAAARAAPEEFLRDDAHNCRVVGLARLPAGWTRNGAAWDFTFAVEGIAHGYLRLVRERVEGRVDVRTCVERRAEAYRFPGAPAEAMERIDAAVWAGQPAVRYEHEATLRGIPCRRRVLALHSKGNWYELIETAYGDVEREEAYAALRAALSEGFRLLTPPAPPAASAPETIADGEMEYRLMRPEGFLRLEIDPARDPGCRVALERVGAAPSQRALVRLFEYGLRPSAKLADWLTIFYTPLSVQYGQVTREPAPVPALAGATEAVAERQSGESSGVKFSSLVIAARNVSGRVFVLQVRTQGGGDREFADGLASILQGVSLAP